MALPITRRTFLKRLGLASAGTALVATYPMFIERQMVQINTYRIPVPNLPAPFEGFTIVQLTDLHFGPLVSLGHLRSVFEMVSRIPKDCIISTGDFIHERDASREIDTIWPLMGKLSAPAGVFSVLGNHDHWGDTDRSLYWMENTGQLLRGRVKKLQRKGASLYLAGGGDLWEDHFSIDRLLDPVPQDECVIVALHNPDSADTIFERQPDLIVSGHTHGGQVQLPLMGAPILPVKNRRYSSGLVTSDAGAPVFISKGIGWALYPVRFNCVPEIAVLELTRDIPAV